VIDNCVEVDIIQLLTFVAVYTMIYRPGIDYIAGGIGKYYILKISTFRIET